jgi:hypothetical protein
MLAERRRPDRRLLPEELPQLSPPAARALLRLLHNVAESDGRGARGSTRAA